MVEISHIVFNGAYLLRLDEFALPAVEARRRSGRPAEGRLDDVQLHPDQPIPHLPAALSASLSRWLEGEGHPGGDAVRPRLRTGPGRLLSPGRSRSGPVLGMVSCSEPGLALLQRRLLGSHAPARHHAIDPVLSGRSFQVSQPRRNLQIKFTRPVAGKNDFVAYIDAIGTLDGTRCLLEWKTSSSRYPEEPEGLFSLDPQLVCYSWMTGIAEVAQIVFVRKRWSRFSTCAPPSPTSSAQEFGNLVESTIRRIESADFLPHSGIRFPQNPCSSCPYVGLCLGKQEMVDASLVRRPGADSLDWLDELSY